MLNVTRIGSEHLYQNPAEPSFLPTPPRNSPLSPRTLKAARETAGACGGWAARGHQQCRVVTRLPAPAASPPASGAPGRLHFHPPRGGPAQPVVAAAPASWRACSARRPCTVDSAMPHAWAVPRSEVPAARSRTTRARTASGTRGRPRRRRSALGCASPARTRSRISLAWRPVRRQVRRGYAPQTSRARPGTFADGSGRGWSAAPAAQAAGQSGSPRCRLRPLAHGRGGADRPAPGSRTDTQCFTGTPDPAPASRGPRRVSGGRRDRVFRYTRVLIRCDLER